LIDWNKLSELNQIKIR